MEFQEAFRKKYFVMYSLLYFIKFGLPGLSCTRFNRQSIMSLPCKPALQSWNMQDFFPVKKKDMAKYFHSELCQTSKMVDFAEIIVKRR